MKSFFYDYLENDIKYDNNLYYRTEWIFKKLKWINFMWR